MQIQEGGHFAIMLDASKELCQEILFELFVYMCNPGHIKTGKRNNYFLVIETHSYFTISKVPWGSTGRGGLTSSIG